MSESNNSEIDLQELAIQIFRYFNLHFKFIFLSSVVTTLLGFTAYFFIPPVYESEMIVMSDILTTTYSDRVTGSINRLIREENDSILAVRLGLPRSEVKSLKGIAINGTREETVKVDAYELSMFVISVEVDNKALLPKLQEGIIAYLRNNEFVNTRVRQRVETYKFMIEQLDREIKSLDSLKIRLFQGKPVYAKTTEMMLVDPTSIYSKSIELSKEKIEYKNLLELFNSIQLVEGFTPFKKAANPKLSIMLIVGLALGFFGSVGILTFNKLWKMARSNN